MKQVLQGLPEALKDRLLDFAFGNAEMRPVEETVPELLASLLQANPEIEHVLLAAPAVDSWLGFASDGQVYREIPPCPDSFARPQQGQLLDRVDLKLGGWLEVWGTPSDNDLHLQVWARAADHALESHRYQEFHHGYRALVDAAVDAIVVIDAKGIVHQFNPGAERMFGYSAAEVLGTSVNCLMPPPHAQDHDSYVNHYLETGEKRIIGIGRRVPGRRKDGSIFPAHLAVSEFSRGGQRYFIGTLRDLSEFLEARSRAVVEERRHLSRELHDSVSQALFGIVLGAQAIKNSLHKPDKAGEAVDYVLHLAESGLAEMRTLIFELRPEALESEGLLVCLGKQTAALGKRYNLQVSISGDTDEPQLDLPVKHEVYRIVMESLHNVVKHARANSCQVHLQMLPGRFHATIIDDGRGFDLAKVPPQKVGLQSMRERVAQLGGQIAIQSTSGQGCRVEVELPAHFR